MALVDLLVAISSMTIAVIALLFAIFQAITAYAQLLSSANRCGRAITGIFDLQDGLWLSFTTLSPSVRYRMPVLTMPGLRRKFPIMGPSPIPEVFTAGNNFQEQENCYLDRRRMRVASRGTRPPPRKIDKSRTIISTVLRMLWSPFGAILSLLLYACFAPCSVLFAIDFFCCCQRFSTDEHGHGIIADCGCGGAAASGECLSLCSLPLIVAWLNPIRYKDIEVALEDQIRNTRTPGLEPAAWAQFLLSHQRAWWGYASLRWEWRLAASIPSDIFGATVESTCADLQLLALMSGMVCVEDRDTFAKSRCGELIELSQHHVIGRMAWYRSTRENTQQSQELSAEVPKSASPWLHYCILACQTISVVDQMLNTRQYPEIAKPGPTTGEVLDSSHVQAVIKQLSRPRTEFDAQLPYSCGDATWIFERLIFKRMVLSYQDLLKDPPTKWKLKSAVVVRGPLGSGVKNCSCARCCQDWFIPYSQLGPADANDWVRKMNIDYVWPALKVHRFDTTNILQIGGSKADFYTIILRESIVPKVSQLLHNIQLELYPFCHKGCADACSCGHIARSISVNDPPTLDECIGIAAINTQWLAKVDHELLELAAEILVFDIFPLVLAPFILDLMMVIGYTETLLLRVQQEIDSQNIWDSLALDLLSDFRPISLG